MTIKVAIVLALLSWRPVTGAQVIEGGQQQRTPRELLSANSSSVPLFLDLTKWPERKLQVSYVVTVSPEPKRYSLPLEVTVLSIADRVSVMEQESIVELRIRNIGTEPYFMPTSLDAKSVQPGNIGRRLLRIAVVDQVPRELDERHPWAMSLEGSSTTPGSLLEIAPQALVILRFSVAESNFKYPAGSELSILVSERTLDDSPRDDGLYGSFPSEVVQSVNSHKVSF